MSTVIELIFSDLIFRRAGSAQQREVDPQCVFKPEKPLDVSTSILISRLTQCPFAAKSGGHSAVPGGSNIEGGITISFEKMSKITLSSDKKTVSFQPGNTWFDIYSTLEKDNVAIIGGRVSGFRKLMIFDILTKDRSQALVLVV